MQTLYKGTINASVLLALLREDSLWHVGERVALLPFCCFLLPLARGGKKKQQKAKLCVQLLEGVAAEQALPAQKAAMLKVVLLHHLQRWG